MTPRPVSEWTIIDFVHRGPWWRNRGILVLDVLLFLPLMSSIANGLDESLANGLQIIPAWQKQFHHPSGSLLGLINSAQGFGCLIGLPFTPLLSDGLGRRPALFFGSLVMLCGVAFQVILNTVELLVISRAIIGFGLAFCMNAAPLLLIELSYPTQRGKVTSMYHSSWYIGSIISAWVCFGAYRNAPNSMWSWRVPTLVQALIPAIQVCLIWFIPESPRYLVSKGLEGKAAKILVKYHANDDGECDPLVVFQIAQIRHALRMEEGINKSASFMSLLSTPGNRKRMILIIALAVFSQWSGNGLVSYYINLVLEGVGMKNPATKAVINGGLQVFNLVIAVSAAMLSDWVGRRSLFIVSNCGMLGAFGAWTISNAVYNDLHEEGAARAVIPLIFLFYFFYDIAYTPMIVPYTLEILPYKIRAKGFAVMNLTMMLTAASNQFIDPWAINAIGWWYYVAYSAWLIFELVFIFSFLVETRGRTLEETAALFDGEEKPQDLMAMGGEAATMTMAMNGTRSHHDEECLPKLPIEFRNVRHMHVLSVLEPPAAL